MCKHIASADELPVILSMSHGASAPCMKSLTINPLPCHGTQHMLQGKDVEYALRAIPLGGFVAFPDDDPKLIEKYPKDDPNLLKNRPIKDRALVISAGIIANCIFAFSILLTQVCLPAHLQTPFVVVSSLLL